MQQACNDKIFSYKCFYSLLLTTQKWFLTSSWTLLEFAARTSGLFVLSWEESDEQDVSYQCFHMTKSSINSLLGENAGCSACAVIAIIAEEILTLTLSLFLR